jgi:hypothetical protein
MVLPSDPASVFVMAEESWSCTRDVSGVIPSVAADAGAAAAPAAIALAELFFKPPVTPSKYNL